MVTNPKDYMREYQRKRRARLKAEKQQGRTGLGRTAKVVKQPLVSSGPPTPTPTIQPLPRPTPQPREIVIAEEPRTAKVYNPLEKYRSETYVRPEPKIEGEVKPETLKFFEAVWNFFTGKKKEKEKEYRERRI